MRTAEDLLRDPEYDDDDENENGRDVPVKKGMASKPMGRQVGTVKAREAVGTLGMAKVPSYAAPTAATKAKVPSGSILGHKKTPSIPATNGGNARTASYQTLGYAKGRAVSSTIRPSAGAVHKDENKQEVVKARRKDPLRELEELIETRELEEAGVLAGDLDDGDLAGGVSLLEDDDEEVFQMKMPDA